MNYYGDFAEDETLYIPFNTFSSDDPSASVTITNLADADIMVHKDGGTTQIATDGATIAIDFDGITGNHLITVDSSAHADYSTGSDYMVRIEGTTVDGATINAWVGSFSIENRFMRGTDSALLAASINLTGGAVDTVTAVTNQVTANVTAISGDTTAADVFEAWLSSFTHVTCASGSTTTAVLPSATYGNLKGALFVVISGTDMESTTIATWVEGTNTATFTDTLGTAVSGSSIVVIIPMGRSIFDAANLLPVEVIEVNGTTQTANDNGADINTLITQIGTAGAGLTDLGAMSTAMKAEILAEMNTALDTAISELGVAAPAATPTMRTGLMLLYMALRNKTVVQTSGTDAIEFHNDAGTLITQKLLTDDGSDMTEAEMS